jgi:hypothetical protein
VPIRILKWSTEKFKSSGSCFRFQERIMPGIVWDTEPYISDVAAEKLRNYVYPGTDDRSPWFNYVLNPLANWFVPKFIPRWLAPNTITLAGLSLVMASSIVISTYCPNYEGVSRPLLRTSATLITSRTRWRPPGSTTSAGSACSPTSSSTYATANRPSPGLFSAGAVDTASSAGAQHGQREPPGPSL